MINYGEYKRALKKFEELPHVSVTKEEFVERLIKNGMAKEEAKLQAKIASIFGSSIEIGGEMVSIKDDTTNC